MLWLESVEAEGDVSSYSSSFELRTKREINKDVSRWRAMFCFITNKTGLVNTVNAA